MQAVFLQQVLHNSSINYASLQYAIKVNTKEDSADDTFGILIKIPHTIHLDLSLIRLGRIQIFSKFIFL